MQNLNVTLVQTIQYWEDKKANLDYLSQKLETLAPCDLLLLPEMFQTGFSMNAAELAENTADSESLNWLMAQADKHQTAIYTSMIVSEDGKFFNRGYFVMPGGKYQYYDKRKLFRMAHEDDYYTPGTQAVVVEWKGWKINLQICYDLRFPELSRNYITASGEANYDICLYVANWPERRAHHWKTLLPARAIENQCYVCGVNRVGQDGNDLIYTGDSMVVNALGEQMQQKASGEFHFQVSLSKSELDQVRKNLNFLKDVDH